MRILFVHVKSLPTLSVAINNYSLKGCYVVVIYHIAMWYYLSSLY